MRRLREASPHQLLPVEVDTLLISGSADEDVPSDMVAAFHQAAITASTNGVTIQLLELDSCDHYQVTSQKFNIDYFFDNCFLVVILRWWIPGTLNGTKFGLKY